MKISLAEFSQYLFGERAKITLSNRIPAAKQEEEIAKIRQKIADKFDFIIANELTLPFRQLLRQLNATYLEDAIYRNHSDMLPPFTIDNSYLFPSDEDIKDQFQKLNDEYSYFSADTEEKQKELFIQFFKACKLIADYVECNNTNNNALPYNIAYKMLVLLPPTNQINPFENADSYLQNFTTSNKPLHNAFIYKLPANTSTPIQDLPGWQALIKKNGEKAMMLFQQAIDIEKINNGKAPRNWEEAQEISSKLCYARQKEHPLLAKLCLQYRVSEINFNKCLDLEKQRKKHDNLPDIIIDGKTVNYPGYYLVKLPLDDPRAYILGLITHCCQYTGGDSEQCVEDSIKRANNSLYVLLKAKNPKRNKPPFIDTANTKINYQDLDIVGTGYAWLSQWNNLTFDSWENLRKENEKTKALGDDAVIVPMLRQFAEIVTNTEANILRVTIGRGGGTPTEFKKSAIIAHPEKQKEGHQYQDSESQTLIYANEVKRIELYATFKEAHQQEILSAIPVDTIENLFPPSHFYGVGQLQILTTLLLQSDSKDLWQELLGSEYAQLSQLLNIAKMENGVYLWDILAYLHKNHYLTVDNFILLLNNPTDLQKVYHGMILLNDADLLNSENLSLILNNSDHAIQIGEALSLLKKENLLTEKIYNLIVKHVQYARNLAIGITKISKDNLFNEENFNLISDNPEFAEEIANALRVLNLAELLTEENHQLLERHPQHAEFIARALAKLKEVGMLTEENKEIIIKNVEYSKDIYHLLILLKDKNILSTERFQQSCQQAEYINNLTSIIEKLLTANMFNDDIFQLLITHIKDTQSICTFLYALEETDLLNDGNLKLFIEHIKYAAGISQSLQAIKKTGILNQNNYQIILDHEEHSESISQVLYHLGDSPLYDEINNRWYNNPHPILTQENFDLTIKNVKYIKNIQEATYHLQKENILNTYFHFIATNANHADSLSKILICLKKQKLLTEDNYGLLEKNVNYADTIIKVLTCDGIETVLNNETFRVLTQTIPTADVNYIGTLLWLLKKHGLMTENNFILALQQAKHAYILSQTLFEFKDDKVTESHFSFIATHANHGHLIRGFIHRFGNSLLGEINQAIINSPRYDSAIFDALTMLENVHSISRADIEVTIHHAEQAKGVALAFKQLANNRLLTEQHRQWIHDYPDRALEISDALIKRQKIEQERQGSVLKRFTGIVAAWANPYALFYGTHQDVIDAIKNKTLPKEMIRPS